MLNDSRTLLDPSSSTPPPAVNESDGALIGGRYRLMRPIGEGGMGNVYLADDLVLARQVAIKTVRPELSGSEEVRARIKRECRLHAAIGAHPHIVTLYDTIEEKGHIYLVMEYFAGETLAARLAASPSRRLPPATALDIVRQLLRGLACIHRRDIVHRDIKSSNLLLQIQADGRLLAKLTDFGIARAELDPLVMTRLTAMATQGPGTPVYMAPERIDPQTFGTVCPASDLYAVGILLFELLAGSPPFTGTTTEIFSGHLLRQPSLETLPPGLPERLPVILQTALNKQPIARYQSAEAFLEALAELEQRAVIAPPPPELTLLAVTAGPSSTSAPAATILHPARGRSRELLQSKPRRRSGLFATALALLLIGFLVHRHQLNPNPPRPPDPVATTTAIIEPTPSPSVTPPSEPGLTAPPKEISALETIEQARRHNSGSMAAAGNESNGANTWQVTENRTRKIH